MLAAVMSGSGSSFEGSSRSAADPTALGSLATALLVGVKLPGVDEAEFDASLDELERLVKTLGYRVVSRITQARASLAPAAVLGEGKLAELASLREVIPPANLVARVMIRLSEPQTPSVWQWLRRPFRIEIRLSPLALIGLALALAAAFVLVGATLR